MTRRILICTIGQTPQVVTETVWALLHPAKESAREPWKPHEIHIVTTSPGLHRVRETLQDPRGQLALLIQQKTPPVTIHLPRRDGTSDIFRPGGTESHDLSGTLGDIRSEQDAAIMGDLILRLIAGFVKDERNEIHVSLAGGRKTMSAHALLAMTLVGRHKDKASHVLVSPEEFEDHPSFWHPDQGGLIPTKQTLHSSNNSAPALDPKNARILLIEAPTPLMRYSVKDARKLETLTLAQVVSELNLAAAAKIDPQIRFATRLNEIILNGVARKFTPKIFAIYRLIATAWQEQWPGVGPDGDGGSGWLSVPLICVGHRPGGKTLETTLLTFISEAAAVDGHDPDDFESVVEWRERVVNEADPRKKRAHAQTAIGGLTRVIQALEDKFGLPVAAVIAPVVVDAHQARPIRGGAISTEGATRFGLSRGIPRQAIKIL